MRSFLSLVIVVALAGPATASGGSRMGTQRQAPDQTQASSHVAWVAATLTRMQTIKPGMTRRELLTVFTTEGGLSARLGRTYVNRDCPYFKVDVTFKAVHNLADGLTEDGNDVIVSISRPYLQFTVLD